LLPSPELLPAFAPVFQWSIREDTRAPVRAPRFSSEEISSGEKTYAHFDEISIAAGRIYHHQEICRKLHRCPHFGRKGANYSPAPQDFMSGGE